MRPSTATALLTPTSASTADIVLLDGFWTPELQVTEVRAEQIDALVTGVADQAFSGEFSLGLTNEAGAPSVRVAGATRRALAEVPVEESDAVVQYRTDSWNRTWRLEIRVHDHGVTEIPVKVLEVSPDVGGGALVADDGWHEAREVLRATGCRTGDLNGRRSGGTCGRRFCWAPSTTRQEDESPAPATGFSPA